MSIAFVPYSESVETIQPDEQKTFDEIAATMRDISHKIGDCQAPLRWGGYFGKVALVPVSETW